LTLRSARQPQRRHPPSRDLPVPFPTRNGTHSKRAPSPSMHLLSSLTRFASFGYPAPPRATAGSLASGRSAPARRPPPPPGSVAGQQRDRGGRGGGVGDSGLEQNLALAVTDTKTQQPQKRNPRQGAVPFRAPTRTPRIRACA